jgi:hypothetical protein
MKNFIVNKLKVNVEKKFFKVSSTWNFKLNHSFNKLWYNWCIKTLPLNDENDVYVESINYKEKFLKILRNSNDLENGRLFQTWPVGPAELNAIATYNNIIASGELLKNLTNNLIL